MKLLIISNRHPYPPEKGDQLIAYEQIRRLTKEHQVYLVCFEPDKKSEALVLFEASLSGVLYLKHRPLSNLLRATRSIWNGKPAQVSMYSASKDLDIVHAYIGRIKPDIILVQTIRMAEYARGIEGIKILDMIDLMSLNMNRRAEHEPAPIARILRWESRLLTRYEAQMHKEYERIVLVSGDDAEYWGVEGLVVNPNGTYITRELMDEYLPVEKENIVLFQGNMNYHPNVEAVKYFAREIWPGLRKSCPEYRFVVVGRNPHSSIRKLGREPGISVLGEVEDMVSLLLKARVGVYLMRSGTGMQNKILEALACDLPVVTTGMGAAGLGSALRARVHVRDEKAEILDVVQDLLSRSEDGEFDVCPERNQVLIDYSWERNVIRLEDILNKAQEDER
jgi:glycosyltransferase involved in cell wall biosynthesis